jgi:hypothetical protein
VRCSESNLRQGAIQWWRAPDAARATARSVASRLIASVRKTLRPRVRVAQLGGFTPTCAMTGLIARVDAGEVSAERSKIVPANLASGSAIAGSLGGGSGSGALPDWLRQLLQRPPTWRRWLLIASIVLVLLCSLIPVIGIVLAVPAVIGGLLLRRWLDAQLAQPPATVGELPTSNAFALTTRSAHPERCRHLIPPFPVPTALISRPAEGGRWC